MLDGPQSIVFDQAENRMHAQKALLLLLLGGLANVAHSFQCSVVSDQNDLDPVYSTANYGNDKVITEH